MTVFKKLHVCTNNGCPSYFGLEQTSIIQGTNINFAGRVLNCQKQVTHTPPQCPRNTKTHFKLKKKKHHGHVPKLNKYV